MAISTEIFQAALKMIQVTPENYKSLNAAMIWELCQVIAQAEDKLREQPSAYAGMTKEQILEARNI